MKVLFVGNPNAGPTMGGSHAFQNTVVNAINRAKSNHKFFYVTPVANQNLVQSMVAANGIEFVYFLSPYYEPCEAPFAITVWDLAHRQMPWFPEVSLSGWTWDQRQAFYSYVLPRASMIVVGHDSLAKAVDHYYHVERDVTKVIPLPVDIDVNGPEEPHPTLKGEKFLLYPAQFWPHKNHITLVNMVDELHNRGLDSKLVFCGSDKGNWNYVQQYIIDKKVPGISYIGFVTPEKLRWLYKHAYACVFSSLMGPDNLPPLEAAAYGCPVVCANYPGDHRGQLVFEPLDAAEAADKVIALEEYKPIPRPTFTGDDYVIAINRMLSEFEYTRRLWGQGYKHT